MTAHVSADFLDRLQGARLVTANILYYLPDHPHILQQFIWQQFDTSPRFPELRKFLEFWDRNIEGKLHGVLVGPSRLIRPGEIGTAAQFRLH